MMAVGIASDGWASVEEQRVYCCLDLGLLHGVGSEVKRKE
jgi:hypothetical protein